MVRSLFTFPDGHGRLGQAGQGWIWLMIACEREPAIPGAPKRKRSAIRLIEDVLSLRGRSSALSRPPRAGFRGPQSPAARK
jgi:hypothetical protein